MHNTRVTICACASRSFIHKEKVAAVAAALKNAKYEVAVVADFCQMAMEPSANMPAIVSGTILACHPRTVLSHTNSLGLKAERVEDMRNTADEVLSLFNLSYSDVRDAAEKEHWIKIIETFPVETGTDAWFPVIDKKRCTECGKCHDFCLFGVYAIENKRVRVAQPQNCKNNCPACARVCPVNAIIFPKYEKSPINGGTAQEETFPDIDNMYRDRLQMRLQQRRASVALLKNDGK